MGKKEDASRDPLDWMKSVIPQEEESETWSGGGRSQPHNSQEIIPEERGDSDIISPTTVGRESWELSRSQPQFPLQPQESQRQHRPLDPGKVPKFETFPVKLTVRISDDQLEFLSSLEKKIMRSRSAPNRAERITKNSVIRVLINALINTELDTKEIRDELELERRIINALCANRPR